MTTQPDPIAWPSLLLAAWPLWAAWAVLLVLTFADPLSAAVARVVDVVRCPGCGAWRIAGGRCSTSRECP